VFPEAFKSSPLLRAWLRRLDALGVLFKPRHRWTGWDDIGALTFVGPDGEVTARPDAAVLALGGASWPRLGSDGGWVDTIARLGIAVTPLMPANCGFTVGWSDVFRARFEGQPLKSVALTFGAHTARGEITITRDGIEGGAIYALSAPIRDSIVATGEALLRIDLRPDVDTAALEHQLGAPRGKQSLSTFLRKAVALASPAIGLLQEAAIAASTKLSATPPAALAALIKAVPIRLTAMAPLAGAISTAGGISFAEIDEQFMLRRKPGVFVAGEMLDWEAPTGGYLLQASCATGVAAAHGVLHWLKASQVSRGPTR
jgi:hypothetical protein